MEIEDYINRSDMLFWLYLLEINIEVIMEKKIENQIVSTSMLVEVITKSTGEKLVIVRGGSPQMPVTLFVGTPQEFSKFALTM